MSVNQEGLGGGDCKFRAPVAVVTYLVEQPAEVAVDFGYPVVVLKVRADCDCGHVLRTEIVFGNHVCSDVEGVQPNVVAVDIRARILQNVGLERARSEAACVIADFDRPEKRFGNRETFDVFLARVNVRCAERGKPNLRALRARVYEVCNRRQNFLFRRALCRFFGFGRSRCVVVYGGSVGIRICYCAERERGGGICVDSFGGIGKNIRRC